MTQKLLELHCRPKQTLTHPRGVAKEEEDHAIFFPIESVVAVRVGVVVVFITSYPHLSLSYCSSQGQVVTQALTYAQRA